MGIVIESGQRSRWVWEWYRLLVRNLDLDRRWDLEHFRCCCCY